MDSEKGRSATDVGVRIYRVKGLVGLLSISRTTIWRTVKRGDYPKPIFLFAGV